MADLTATPATGAQQSSTSNPQTVPSGQSISGASNRSGGVQPGTATSVLTSNNGLSLELSPVTTVSLSKSAGTGAQSRTVSTPEPVKHQVNGTFIIIPIVLVVIAVGLFWSMSRSAKSTTNYS
ncbi:MAG TPA: hypothetical protein VD706_01860 [Candidatus Saccharimonadales bacterium]|nr:hypothetical protein [Candidatus Saccharimonadales bacterium]